MIRYKSIPNTATNITINVFILLTASLRQDVDFDSMGYGGNLSRRFISGLYD